MHRLANEGVSLRSEVQQIVAIDGRSAGGREAVGGVQIVKAGQRLADGTDLRRALRERSCPRRRRPPRIAPEILVRQGIMPEGIRVVAAEPVSPVVAIAAVLRAAGLRVEAAVV